MLERYRRMFLATQILIFVLAVVIYRSSGGLWPPTVFFFVMMQGFALIGAGWSARLKRLMESKNGARLPLESRG
jgi:hypothetical protein